MKIWQKYVAVGTASMATSLLIAFSVTVALDPFGRLGFKKSDEIGFVEERPTMAARAVDPQFNSAIIGNSSSMVLMPQNLDRLTGQKFVSLSISGSNAPASLATMTFFLAHHSDAKIVVVALLTDAWCGPTFQEKRPFPFWLYSSLPQYLWGLARNTSLKLIKTRFAQVDNTNPWIQTDGYHSYVGPFLQPSYNDVDYVRSLLNTATRARISANPTGQFVSIYHLADAIKSSETFYVIVWTPRYYKYAPEPGSDAEKTDRQCKATLIERTAQLKNVRVIDWSEADRPENNDPANFFDPIHYRRRLAERVEADIKAALPAELKEP